MSARLGGDAVITETTFIPYLVHILRIFDVSNAADVMFRPCITRGKCGAGGKTHRTTVLESKTLQVHREYLHVHAGSY